MNWKFVGWVFCLLCVLAVSGCGNDATDKKTAEESLGEWFQRTQKDTTMSHGDVLPNTARQEGNAVIFETSDGTWLRQEYRSDGDGGYERIGDPVKMRPAEEGQFTGNDRQRPASGK
jgi:hypothetical protein